MFSQLCFLVLVDKVHQKLLENVEEKQKSQGSLMKALTQFLTASHKGRLMRLSEAHAHTCV